MRVRPALSRLARAAAGITAAAAVLSAAGCTANAQPAPSPDTSGIAVDAALAARVPQEYRADGVLTIATDATYAPMEFRKDGELTGVDIDFARALGAVLGIQVEFSPVTFNDITPSVAIGRFELGIAAMWANDSDAALVDMVSYFQAGAQFAATTGPDAPTSTGLGLCGHSVSVEEGTQLVDELAAVSKQCVKNGAKPLAIKATNSQSRATELLISGKAQAMVADTPVVTYAVANHPDTIRLLGSSANVEPYGIAAARTYEDWPALVRDAVQKLIDGGQYAALLKKWDVEQGAISRSQVYSAHPVIETPGATAAPFPR